MHALGIIAETAGVKMGELGTTTFRPPYTPLTFGAIVGRNVGNFLILQEQLLCMIGMLKIKLNLKMSANGKSMVLSNKNETMHQAVQRESKAARDSAGILDASTLGKIDIQGK